ncbi:Ig-like domain-containing protein [Marinimicrobium alkaliphilum]|uniref:Ig-like domain-containing protein n=1 Tax=Marinimicrobium alkaliphilum TaxID=2202654 RepID=UPI000DB9C825|nr:Ig-like domain-containing protein [Marinimicrobium alkaliphilum]
MYRWILTSRMIAVLIIVILSLAIAACGGGNGEQTGPSHNGDVIDSPIDEEPILPTEDEDPVTPPEEEPAPAPITSIELNVDRVDLKVDDTQSLTAVLHDADGDLRTDQSVTWASEDVWVATVDETGLVTAEGAGQTVVTATLGNISASAQVSVEKEGMTLKSISAGYYHTCGVTPDGKAYCWGSSTAGALGNGDDSGWHVTSPQLVSGEHEWASVSAGRQMTCGVTTSGDAYCWGAGSTGQLGNGGESSSATPVPVAGGIKWSEVSAGYLNTCGVSMDGDAYCWGEGGSIVSSDARQLTPKLVSGGYAWISTSVAQRIGASACGLSNSEKIYCWGRGAGYELFNGKSTAEYEPIAVGAGRQWASIIVGPGNTCAITTEGEGYCVGRTSRGETGTGSTESVQIEPALVAGGHQWRSFAIANKHACGVTVEGNGYCWGEHSGAVGDGNEEAFFTVESVPVPVAGGLEWAEISVGSGHSCGITMAGAAYCWGNNGYGQLGMSGRGIRYQPEAVPAP